MILVADHHNPHTLGALYEAFPPSPRRPDGWRHGCWLNVAEIARSALTLQGLPRRIPDLETLRAERAAWARARHQDPTPVHWPCTTADARIQLHSLYPV